MMRMDRAQVAEWIAGELCPGGQSINAMLEHVFLWCRDRRIYGPSRNELERVVRSQRQDYLDTWLIGASDRLSSAAVALLEASLADPDSRSERGCLWKRVFEKCWFWWWAVNLK